MVSVQEPPQDGDDARSTVAVERTAFGSEAPKQSIILFPFGAGATVRLVVLQLPSRAFCIHVFFAAPLLPPKPWTVEAAPVI